MNKIAIVFSEGAMRCAYSVGVALALVDKYKLTDPDIIIGASGSSGIAAYFVAKQFEAGRNIWENLLSTKNFISFLRLTKVVDVDYVIDEIFKKQEPLDTEAIKKSKTKLFIAVTNQSKGETEYFSNQDDIFEVLRASNAILLFYGRKIKIGEHCYYDGAISTSFKQNIEKAKDLGATKIIAIDNINPSLVSVYFLKLYKLLHPSLKKVNLGSIIDADERVLVLKAPIKLPVTGALDNDSAHLQETIKIGYADVVNNKKLEEFLKV